MNVLDRRAAPSSLPCWEQLHAVIFDMDGTLYDQGKLRRKMTWEMLSRLGSGQLSLREIRIISYYRRRREQWAEANTAGLSRNQYALIADELGIETQTVEMLVTEWLLRRPLKFLRSCRFPAVEIAFSMLRSRGLRIGIFSDYPPEEKLAALGLEADAVSYSLEYDIDRLKPNSGSLAAVVRRLALSPGTYLVIGDRDSRDGECARSLGAPFICRRGGDFFARLAAQLGGQCGARRKCGEYIGGKCDA